MASGKRRRRRKREFFVSDVGKLQIGAACLRFFKPPGGRLIVEIVAPEIITIHNQQRKKTKHEPPHAAND